MNLFLSIRKTSFIFKNIWLIAVACMVVFAACDSASNEPDPVPLSKKLIEDVPADPVSERDATTGRSISNNLFTLYDLEKGEIVLSSEVTDPTRRRTDSTATVWDIGFRGTTVIFNGGDSGPGKAQAQILRQPFSEVTEAPADGYISDGENTSCPQVQTPGGPVSGSTLAVCTGSGNGWYNYDSSQGLISPIPGRTIALKTATENYASLRILSYYQNNPNPPDPNAKSRYYTFEYILQANGSRNLRTTTTN